MPTSTCLHIPAYPFVPTQAELQLWPAIQHPLQFNTHFFAVSQQRAGLVANPTLFPSVSEKKDFLQQSSVPSELALLTKAEIKSIRFHGTAQDFCSDGHFLSCNKASEALQSSHG